MSQNTSQKDLADSPAEDPLYNIRSQKLREFFARKPSYLRSLTPDASYSTMPDFQKSTPLTIDHLGLDQVDFSHSQKIVPNTHRPSMQKDQKESQSVMRPYHKFTRSRSTNELEQMIENVRSKDLLTEVNYGLHRGSRTIASQRTSKKDDKNLKNSSEGNKALSNAQQTLRGRTKNRNFESDVNNLNENKEIIEQEKGTKIKNKQGQVEDLNRSFKKETLDDSMNKDNSIGHIIDMMGPSPNHRNLDDLDLMNKESAPLSSMPSDELFGVQQFFPGDMKDLIGSGNKATSINTENLGSSPPGNSKSPYKGGNNKDEKGSHADHLGSTQATGMVDSNTPNKQINPQGIKQLGPRQMTFDLVPSGFNPSFSNRPSERERISHIQFAESMRNTHTLQNQEVNARFASSFGSKRETLGQSEFCRFHPSNAISYICIKDNCGELLCPLCLYEHQKNKHVGEYEAIPSFVSDSKQKLIQVRENFLGTIEQIVSLQTTLSDRGKFDLKLVEEIDRIEMSLVKNVKQFFDNIREEYSKDLFFDFPKISDDLNLLHYDLNSAIKTLEEDLQAITKETPSLNPNLLTHIVQKGYVNSSINYKRSLNEIDHRVKQFMKTGPNSTRKLHLELNPNLKTKFTALLAENIRFVENNPSRTGRLNSNDENYYTKTLRIPEKVQEQFESFTNTENMESLPDVEGRKDRLETDIGRLKTSESQNNDKRTRTVSPWKGPPGSQTGTLRVANPSSATNTAQNSQKGPKNYFANKKLTDTITNRVLEMYQSGGHSQQVSKSVGEKDLEVSSMRFLIEYLERFYGTSKIRILDPTFFQRLLGTYDFLDFSDFGRKDLFFDGVNEDLQLESGKGKCVFTSYEKVFILGKIQNTQWVLIEVRNNPKAIILYDFLGKLNKTKFSENVFALVLEIIRREYNSKLGQNPENYLWEKKVAVQPVLIVKNGWDTGILALKVISNCYQNKDFSSGKITLNEITLTRKKLEKIFKMYEEKKNHDKFVPI